MIGISIWNMCGISIATYYDWNICGISIEYLWHFMEHQLGCGDFPWRLTINICLEDLFNLWGRDGMIGMNKLKQCHPTVTRNHGRCRG